VKWDYEYDWQQRGGQRFLLVAESNGVPVHHRPARSESGLKKFWLRLTKRSDRFEYAWSKDGKEWVAAGELECEAGSLRKVGLIAKNGGNKEAAEIDAAFEFFELRAVPPAKK
jgi:hypothetical protein